MIGKTVHNIKKKIPYRKLALGLNAVQKKCQPLWIDPGYLQSWCAMRAGLWHDDYFCSLPGMLATDIGLRNLVISINYKRIKYGWSLEELEELTGSSNCKTYSNHPSFNALIASLIHEMGDFEKALCFLNKALIQDPGSTDGYLGLSVFALNNNLGLSDISHQTCEKMLKLFHKFESFSNFFENELKDKKIAIVGNANTETGSSNGRFIDSHDIVFRFNNFASRTSYEKDYGKKTTVWVRTPSIHEVPLREDISPKTVVFSSSLMLYTKNGNWKWMLDYCDRDENIVLLDDSIFRDLVQKLNSPPTAGLLTTANISGLSDDLSQISFLGFDFNTGKQSHYFDNQKPAGRHNWNLEKELFLKITERSKITV